MRAARLLGIFIVLMLPVSLFGVTLTVGNDITSPNASDGNIGAIRTDIDLVHPATHTGSVSSAKLYWSSSGCANAFKIKFFRRVGDTFTMTAERGPFTPTANLYTATLTPAVSVQQGDLIAVARVASCGNGGAITGFPSEGYLQYAGDVTGSVTMAAAAMHQGGVLALSATGTASEWMARIIPVVGSAPGAFGSRFKTEMQFFNPQTSGSMTAKVVFHPAGVAGSTSDTTRLVMLDPGEVFSTADVVAAMGQSGTGSLDISVPAGQNVPVILTRVYNDAGAAGTSSLTEEPIPVSGDVAINANLLTRGVTGFLVTPRDPEHTRFNIGVRTLYSGATIQVTLRNAAGVVVRTVSHTYTANYFIQTDAASFVGGPIAGDESIQISISSGSAIVYGSTTDNTTNDPAIQFVYGVFAIA
ncbi:MAG TPA: hypothetical protein VF215_08435 [Thermoanaerobaculia bacterium]